MNQLEHVHHTHHAHNSYHVEDAVVASELLSSAAPTTMQAGANLAYDANSADVVALLPAAIINPAIWQKGNKAKWSFNAFGNAVEKKGGFTPFESNAIKQAIHDFCGGRGIESSALFAVDRKSPLRGAWIEIAKVAPERSIQSIYRHACRQLHPFKRGPWTEDECMALAELVAERGKKWAGIQTVLNRSADACRDKYREMDAYFVRGRWTADETNVLISLVWEWCKSKISESMLSSALQDRSQDLNAPGVPSLNMKALGNVVKRFTEGNSVVVKIPWTDISKKIGNRSRLSCFKKWQKITGVVTNKEDSMRAVDEQEFATSQREVAVNTHPVASISRTSYAPPVEEYDAVQNPNHGQIVTVKGNGFISKDDSVLLTQIMNTNPAQLADFDWDSSMHPQGAWERWSQLVNESGVDPRTYTIRDIAMHILQSNKMSSGTAI